MRASSSAASVPARAIDRTMSSRRAWSVPAPERWRASKASRARRAFDRASARAARSASSVAMATALHLGGDAIAQDQFDLFVGAGDHVHRDDLADLSGGHGPGVGGGLDGAHVAPDHDGDQPAADLLPPDQSDVGGFDHGVGGLDGADEPSGLDEAQGSAGNAPVPVPVSGHGGYFLPLAADGLRHSV